MRSIGRAFLLAVTAALLCSALVHAQDSESLGDVARQTREQKQARDAESKDVAAKDGEGKSTLSKTPKVITNEEIPEHPEDSPSEPTTSADTTPAPAAMTSGGTKASAEQWKAQIAAQKNVVTSLRSNIEKLESSVQFAPGNCVSGCVQWNLRQKQKQEQVEHMKAELEQQQNRLDTMQNTARRQGYGSSVYEP